MPGNSTNRALGKPQERRFSLFETMYSRPFEGRQVSGTSKALSRLALCLSLINHNRLSTAVGKICMRRCHVCLPDCHLAFVLICYVSQPSTVCFIADYSCPPGSCVSGDVRNECTSHIHTNTCARITNITVLIFNTWNSNYHIPL